MRFVWQMEKNWFKSYHQKIKSFQDCDIKESLLICSLRLEGSNDAKINSDAYFRKNLENMQS